LTTSSEDIYLAFVKLAKAVSWHFYFVRGALTIVVWRGIFSFVPADYWVSGQQPPGQLPPWQLPPRTTITLDNRHQGQLPSGQLPSGQLSSRANSCQVNCHPRQLLPRPIATQGDCQPHNVHLGQMPPTTIATGTTAT